MPPTQPTDPAFPVSSGGALFDGLTKLELFAAMAIQGFCANPSAFECTHGAVAEFSVDAAKALIEALEKEEA